MAGVLIYTASGDSEGSLEMVWWNEPSPNILKTPSEWRSKRRSFVLMAQFAMKQIDKDLGARVFQRVVTCRSVA